jgi:nucleolar complex protein 2
MGKTTKRARKFEKTGGVKDRLDKGTITSKGKLKRKRKADGNGGDAYAIKKAKAVADEQLEKERVKKVENDFTSDENVGDLDLESFFEKTVEDLADGVEDDEIEEEEQDDDDEDDDDEDDEDSMKDGGSDSDDDNVEDAAERMQREMDKLSKTDPEFHNFLQENEQDLLDFDAKDHDVDIDDGEETQEKKSNVVVVTPELLDKIVQGAFKSHGVKSLKKLVQIYKAACHLSDADQKGDGDKGKKYHIESRKIFDHVMVMTLTQCHEEFTYHLLGKGAKDPNQSKKKKQKVEDEPEEEEDEEVRGDNTPLSPKKLMRSYRWKDIHSILQTFFKATLHVLSEGKDPQHLTFVLKALGKYIPFLTPVPKMAQLLLRSLTNLWSAPLDSSEDYQVVRLNAFIRIRQLAITQQFPFIEDCLKKTYLAYAKRAKYGTSATVTSVLPTLTFMGNCVVELYSLDFHSSYQHAFVYIRQLALHLRSAMQKKTAEAFQVVYCWQYIHCLKLWTAVLVQACKMAKDLESSRNTEAELLESLIYPLTEVIQGVVRLVPTTRHLPLRLQCVRFLQQLASGSERFIPTTSIILEALDLKEISMSPKRDKTKGVSRGTNLSLIIKLPKENTLRTSEQLEACMSEIFVLLNREVDLYRYSPGFPEFTVLICQRLRKYVKTAKNGRWRAYAKGCIDLCERQSAFARTERSKLTEAPKDIKRLEALKPASEASMGERYETAIGKEKRLEEATRPAAKNKKPVVKKQIEQAESAPVRKTAKKQDKKEKALSAQEALEQEDEVAEGIDWSGDENDSDDDDMED